MRRIVDSSQEVTSAMSWSWTASQENFTVCINSERSNNNRYYCNNINDQHNQMDGLEIDVIRIKVLSYAAPLRMMSEAC